MLSLSHETVLKTFLLLAGLALGHSFACAGELAFSKPEQLTTIPWFNGSNQGVSPNGPEWLVVDNQRRYWLEEGTDFRLYTSNGHYLRTVSPLDKQMDFYGLASTEALPDGHIILLQRQETRSEQERKFNYENRSQPGVLLIVLKNDGTVEKEKVEVDPHEPHSDYYLEGRTLYSIHDDGTYEQLDSIGSRSIDHHFGNFAAVDDPKNWLAHVKTLPIFHSENRYYQDMSGKLHADKNAKSFLMGQPFVEGTSPLAERNGIIYYRVVCCPLGNFTHKVFVEDPIHKNYALIDLVAEDEDLDAANNRALFVNEKGDLFEGVAEKEGYRIYEWKIL